MNDTCRIDGDCWEGVMNHEWCIDAASLEEVNSVLDRLDAAKYTMLTIRGAGPQYLTVGGGAGRYIVYVAFGGEEFWNLMLPRALSGTVLLNVGGQEGDYPAEQVVDIAQARAAVRAFCLFNALDPRQRWAKQ